MTWNSSSRTTALCECSTVRRPVADFLEREEEGIPHGRRRREQMGEGRDIGVPVEPNPTAGTTSLATAAASQMRRLNGECSAQRPKTAWNRSSDWDTNTDTAWNRSSDSDSDTDTDTVWNRSSDSLGHGHSERCNPVCLGNIYFSCNPVRFGSLFTNFAVPSLVLNSSL
jgi:hypothetical protein